MFDKQRWRLFMTAFGAHLPDGPQVLQEQNVYPISVQVRDGLDLDYSSLLVVDEILIDKLAVELVNDNKRAYLKPMKETIHALREEGMLTVTDYGSIATPLLPEVRQTVDTLLEVPEFWLTTARNHWNEYRSKLPGLVNLYGPNTDADRERMHFGVYCYHQKVGTMPPAKSISDLHWILESKKRRLTPRGGR